MAEGARHEGGDRDVRAGAARRRYQVGREREFGDVEFLMPEGALKDLFRLPGDDVQPAALDRHATVDEGARAIDILAGERQFQHETSNSQSIFKRRSAMGS